MLMCRFVPMYWTFIKPKEIWNIKIYIPKHFSFSLYCSCCKPKNHNFIPFLSSKLLICNKICYFEHWLQFWVNYCEIWLFQDINYKNRQFNSRFSHIFPKIFIVCINPCNQTFGMFKEISPCTFSPILE